jgi:type VI secretion system secreted protein Hcp
MAVDMFLKIDDIKGESIDATYKDAIKVLSWSWGMSQSGSTHSGTGSGSGKVAVQDISITKPLDKSTPNLIKMCCQGTHFKTATLIIRKAGGKKPVDYLKIEMTRGLISSISTGGAGGEDEITEQTTLNFGAFKLEYKPQAGEGAAEAAIPAAFDIAKNSES